MNKFIAIDRGNTRIKIGKWVLGKPIHISYFDTYDEDGVLHYLKNHTCTHAIISNVAGEALPIVHNWLSEHVQLVTLTAATPLPILNKYYTPETLGSDRLAGAVAAWQQAKTTTSLVFDLGTCMNVELVHNGAYEGGAISPGLHMRLKSMHEFTGKLPLLPLPAELISLTGKSTVESMYNGAILGMAMEIDACIAMYSKNYPDLTVFFTGGDAEYLGKYIKNSIFARQEMVIEGLIEILKYNATT